MSKLYDPMAHTPEEWRAMGRQKHQDADDSFERCDTDGFLSQWASGMMGNLYETCAQVAENGGKASFPALFDLEGNPVNARLIEGKYDWCWMLLDEQGHSTSKFAPHAPSRPSTLAKRGLMEKQVEADALVTLVGSNACNVTPIKVRKPANWSAR